MDAGGRRRRTRPLIGAVAIGLTVALVLSLAVIALEPLGDIPGNHSALAISPAHAAATPLAPAAASADTFSVPRFAADGAEGDSTANDYRLERDSCCIGNQPGS